MEYTGRVTPEIRYFLNQPRTRYLMYGETSHLFVVNLSICHSIFVFRMPQIFKQMRYFRTWIRHTKEQRKVLFGTRKWTLWSNEALHWGMCTQFLTPNIASTLCMRDGALTTHPWKHRRRYIRIKSHNSPDTVSIKAQCINHECLVFQYQFFGRPENVRSRQNLMLVKVITSPLGTRNWMR